MPAIVRARTGSGPTLDVDPYEGPADAVPDGASCGQVDAAALVPLLVLLLVKEAGVPVPVPGDLLVLGAGVAAAGRGAVIFSRAFFSAGKFTSFLICLK